MFAGRDILSTHAGKIRSNPCFRLFQLQSSSTNPVACLHAATLRTGAPRFGCVEVEQLIARGIEAFGNYAE